MFTSITILQKNKRKFGKYLKKNLQNKSSSLLNISNFVITIIINYIFEIGR